MKKRARRAEKRRAWKEARKRFKRTHKLINRAKNSTSNPLDLMINPAREKRK